MPGIFCNRIQLTDINIEINFSAVPLIGIYYALGGGGIKPTGGEYAGEKNP
jgi:hypothetical protein